MTDTSETLLNSSIRFVYDKNSYYPVKENGRVDLEVKNTKKELIRIAW